MSAIRDRRSAGHGGRRPLRVAPAWVGAARPGTASSGEQHLLPVREAVWVWSVRQYARIALWALPAGAVLYGWHTLGIAHPSGSLMLNLTAAWLSTVAMVALAGLLAGSRTRRTAVAGMVVGLAGTVLLMPLAALPAGIAPNGISLPTEYVRLAAPVAATVVAAGWLMLGWAVFRSQSMYPADGVLLMLAAVAIGTAPFAIDALSTVGALLLLAAGTGIAWTGGRLLPRA